MSKSPRSLYSDNLNAFLEREDKSIFSVLCDAYLLNRMLITRGWLTVCAADAKIQCVAR